MEVTGSLWYPFFSVIGIVTTLGPFILAIVLLRWLFVIKRNSNEQLKQNEEIITLLNKINNNPKK
ncbi:hypothetical protein ACFFHM_00550 [Halalkalibacter kiskunsagensis]|uniref:Uncharacterized protein n=1 Tax=Halalkalibacter kiskunsagensis TaxID=1548599 RepID=A0ABV6KAG8_9BACI